MRFLTHNDLVVTEQPIPIARLPEALTGLKLVQISDLHFYEFTNSAYYEKVVAAVNEQQPDLILLTGDVVHHGPDYIDAAQRFLARLQAKRAKLAILGNHDYQDSQLGALISAMLPQAGFQLLKNSHYCLEQNGKKLWLVGLDDLWYGAPDIPNALAAVPTANDVTVALVHNPLLFDPLALAGHGRVDLVVAGHTHAGHVYIPFLGPIYRKIFRMKYRYGLFEKNGCQLYVTSGVGSAAFYLKKRKIGFPRFRYNTRPEIAVLKLVRR